jgi:uncharacterized protein (TIGR02246 family)
MRSDRRSSAEDLAALRHAFHAAVGRSDLEATAAAYADDALLILPSGAAIDGRAAIERFWQTGFETGTSAIDFVPDGIEVGDRVAWEFGTYGLSATPPEESPATELGRYLTVHRRGDDGRWQRAVDVLNPTGLMVAARSQPDLTTMKESPR